LEVTAVDPVELLDHRTIAYNADTAYTRKRGKSDNLLKAFVRENMASLAVDADRNMEPWLTVQADAGLGQTTVKAASRRKLLPVFQEIADDSFMKGTYLAFDIVSTVPLSGAALEFRTYVGARGVDNSWPNGLRPVLLDPENGNLTEVERDIDNLEMANAIYAGGQGQGDVRIIKTAIDAASATETPWARHEDWIDARNTSNPNAVQAEANFELRQRRTRKTFTARFVDTPGIRFGVQFGFGDVVTCVWDDELFNMRVDSVSLKVSEGKEVVDVILRSDS
jgi:hypothetical protein